MPLQNFIDNSLPTIKAAWLNAVDAFYFTLFNSATTAAQARTALGSTTVGDAVFIAANAAAGRTAIGTVIGTDVQAYDAELAALAGLTSAADKVPYFTGSGTASTFTADTFGRSIMDDGGYTAMRTTMGAGVYLEGPNVTTSGTSVQFSNLDNLPLREVTINLIGVSLNGTADIELWIGGAGGAEETAYVGATTLFTGTAVTSTTNWSTEAIIKAGAAAATICGQIRICAVDETTGIYSISFVLARGDSGVTQIGAGYKTIAGGSKILDTVVLKSSNGTDTFDAGSWSLTGHYS